jgi:hypothetical protein
MADDHFENGHGADAVAKRPYNDPPKRRTGRQGINVDEWNTFVQWMRGTMEYPDGGGFAGDVGRRLTSLEQLEGRLDDLPAVIATQTADAIKAAFAENRKTVALAKAEADDTTTTTRRLALRGRAVTAAIAFFVVVIGGFVLALLNHWFGTG